MGKKLLFSCLLLLTVAFVTAESLFGFLQPDGESVTVPNFCGEKADAIHPSDVFILQTEYRYDETAPEGIVMTQWPEAGSVRKLSDRRPCEIKLTVSLGVEKKTVPSIVGQDAREATALLREQGFSVSEESVKSADANSGGTVARTEPPAGTELKAGSEIKVYVYVTEHAKSVAVPSLLGLPRGQALLQLYLHGLSAGEVTEEPSEQPEGTVIRQSPPAGSYVAEGTKIRLVISAPAEE